MTPDTIPASTNISASISLVLCSVRVSLPRLDSEGFVLTPFIDRPHCPRFLGLPRPPFSHVNAPTRPVSLSIDAAHQSSKPHRRRHLTSVPCVPLLSFRCSRFSFVRLFRFPYYTGFGFDHPLISRLVFPFVPHSCLACPSPVSPFTFAFRILCSCASSTPARS